MLVNQFAPLVPSTQQRLDDDDDDDNMISSESFEDHDTLSNDNISDNGISSNKMQKVFRPKTFIERQTTEILEIFENPKKFDNDKRSSVVSKLKRGDSVIDKIVKINELDVNPGLNKALNYLKRNNKPSFAPLKRMNSVMNDTHNDIDSFRNDFLNSFLNYNRYVDPKRRSDLTKKVNFKPHLIW